MRHRRAVPHRGRRHLTIAGLYGEELIASHYRAVVPLKEMERRGHIVLWPSSPSLGAVLHGLPSCDVVLIHRMILAKDLALVERLREAGIATVWDVDDYLGTYSRVNRRVSPVPRRAVRKGFERSKAIARLASVTTSPSDQLLNLYSGAGAGNVMLIPNSLPAFSEPPRRRSPGVVIGWTAAREHETDMSALGIKAVLKRLIETDPFVQVVTIGVDLGFTHRRYQRLRDVPVERLIEAERRFDIGIAPIADTAFNRCRSDVKVREYATAGAAWLASPIGPYSKLGEAEGGQLVQDRDWFAALAALAADPRRRGQLRAHARRWAQSNTISAVGDQWERAFRLAVSVAS